MFVNDLSVGCSDFNHGSLSLSYIFFFVFFAFAFHSVSSSFRSFIISLSLSFFLSFFLFFCCCLNLWCSGHGSGCVVHGTGQQNLDAAVSRAHEALGPEEPACRRKKK